MHIQSVSKMNTNCLVAKEPITSMAWQICQDSCLTYVQLKQPAHSIAIAALELASRIHEGKWSLKVPYAVYRTQSTCVRSILFDLMELYVHHGAQTSFFTANTLFPSPYSPKSSEIESHQLQQEKKLQNLLQQRQNIDFIALEIELRSRKDTSRPRKKLKSNISKEHLSLRDPRVGDQGIIRYKLNSP